MGKQQFFRQCLFWHMVILAVEGCNFGSKSKPPEDDFYTNRGGWDWVRIPLLKPYEAIKVDPEIETNGWSMKLYSSLYRIDRVKQIDIQDSNILVRSGRIANNEQDNTSIGTLNVPSAWFAINVHTKVERGFATEKEFLRYIDDSVYIKPQWKNIDSLSRALMNTGKLPWVPS